jgi:NAD-dependent SIR2 family protein deacetylase
LHTRHPASTLRRIEAEVARIAVGPDPEIFDVRLPKTAKVTLLLGAGASAPEPSGIPTVAYLLPELWRRAKKMGREDIDGLADWCNGQRITNIEDLLTAAYVANFAAKNPNISGLLDYFLFGETRNASEEARFARGRSRPLSVDSASIALVQDTLQILFGLLAGIMLPARPNAGHEAIVSFAQAHPRTSIVTTNYDGCIDEALTRANVRVDTHLDESTAIPEQDCLDLIKMHGSINWTYCDSCQEVRQFDLLRMKQDYDDDTASYAVISICRACGGQRRPLLVPPMAFKFILFPNLIGLWNLARERIEGADYLIVVGHSFSEADSYISKIITRSLTVNELQRMIVIDPAALLVPQLRDRFAAHIDGFDPKRVLRGLGSSEELLPSILSSLISPAQPTVRAEPENANTNGAATNPSAVS